MNGRELKSIRKRLGLSQEALGERLGVERNTVARWERGEVGMSEPAARLTRILGGEPVAVVLQGVSKRSAKKSKK